MANERETQSATREAAQRVKDTAGEGSREAARESAKDHSNGGDGRPVEASTRRAADAAREMAEDAGRTGRHAAEHATELGREAARHTLDTGRKVAKAGAETAERGAEAFRETTREMAGTAQKVAGQVGEQINRMLGLSAEAQEEVAHHAQHNVEIIAQCGNVVLDGVQSIWREWLSFTQEALQRNVDGVNTMMRSRSVQDFYSAQSELLKDELQLWLHRSVRISEVSAKAAADAARRIGERHDQHSQHSSGRRPG